MKDEGKSSVSLGLDESSDHELEVNLEQFRKRFRREPNFFFTVLISCFTCCGLFYATNFWVKNHEFWLSLIVPFVNSFLTTWYYNSRKDYNPFSVFFLSIVPVMVLPFLLGIFYSDNGVAVAILFPFLLPITYLGGILGGGIGTMTNEYDSMFKFY